MDGSIERVDKVEPSSSKVMKTELFDDYHTEEEPLESELPQDNFVGQIEVKSELNDENGELTNNQDFSVSPLWPHQKRIKIQCNSEIKEERLESNSLEDSFVGPSKRKRKCSQPSDEFESSQKPSIPSTSKLNIKSASNEEILKSKSFKDYVAELQLCKETGCYPKMELNKSNWNYIAVESPEPSEVVPKAEILKKQQPDVIHTLEKPYICIAVSRYRYKCTFCDSSFKLESEVKKHILKFCKNVIIENKMLKHSCSTPPCNIPCTRSTMQYPIESVLEGKKPNKGSLVHEHGGLHTCTECGNKFETERNLNHHLDKIHKKTRLFTCKLCRKEFKDNSNRCRHMKICKKSDQTTESECYSDTRKEILFGQKVKGVEIFKYEKGKRNLTPILQTKKAFKDYLTQEKGEQLDTETQIQGENLESNLSEDNFVGLCEIKSEFSETNDEFMENQVMQEIDPLEVQTEDNSTVLDSDCHKKSSLNCNYKTAEKEEFANHIASTDQGNINLDKGINIREKKVIFHVDKKVKIQLRFSCPSKNCNFKTLVRKEIKDHLQSVHKGDIHFYTTFREKIYEPGVEGRAVPSTSKPNVKPLKYQEVLKLKSFQDYVAGLNKDRFT